MALSARRWSRECARLGLQETVHFPGYVSQPERILEETDLMVLPSHTEGLPNAALEAMAMEVPVLATRVGGTPEVVSDGETGRLVDPRSPEMLARASSSSCPTRRSGERWAGADGKSWRGSSTSANEPGSSRGSTRSWLRRLAHDLQGPPAVLRARVRASQSLPARSSTTLKFSSIVPIGLALAAIAHQGPGHQPGRSARSSHQAHGRPGWECLASRLLTAPVTFYAFETLKGVFGYLLIFWVIAKQVDDTNKLLGVFRTLVAVHLALAVLNPQLLTNPEARNYLVSAPFLGDGNDFALSVNIAIPFCYGLLVTAAKKRSKAFYTVALLVLVACVVATQSRGATVALACVAVYYWLRTKRS